MSLHRNAKGGIVPSHLWEVAYKVNDLFMTAEEQWRDQITEWTKQQIDTLPSLQPHEDELPADDDEDAVGRPAGEYAPLPLTLTTPEKYAILAAVHDFAADAQTERIGAYDEEQLDSFKEGVPYTVLVLAVGNLPETDADRLMVILDDVRSDLNVALTEAEYESQLRDLIASHDNTKIRLDVPDRGIGHMLHCGYMCESALIRLLKFLLVWLDEHKLDEHAVQSTYEELIAASEEADGITRGEERVFTHVSGSTFEFLGQDWQSGHECLFYVANQMAIGNRAGNYQESLEQHFMWRNKDRWRRLLVQVARERSLAESGNEVAYQQLSLIQFIQQIPGQEETPEPLDGTFPEGSPRAKRRRSAKQGAETRKANKQKKREDLARAQASAKMSSEPSLEAKLTWKIHHEEKGRTQKETAAIMSERLGFTVLQQWVSDRLSECKKWVAATNLTLDDIEDLPGGRQRPMSPRKIDMGLPARSAQQRKAEQISEGNEDSGWQQEGESVKPDDSFDGSGYGPTSEKKDGS